MAEPLWKPTREQIERSNLKAFIQFVEQSYSLSPLSSFDELYRWSTDHIEDFWLAVWRFCGMQGDRDPDTVVADLGKMPGAKWFPGVRLNFAENLLRYRDDREALVFWNENGRQQVLTFAELYNAVARVAAALRAAGVTKDDRVAGYLPNMPETIVGMLATTSLGAVWSSCSPDFGLKGVLDRFGQIEPKVLFAADGYFFKQRTFDSLEKIKSISESIPSLERIVVVPYTRADPPLEGLRNAVLYSNFQDSQSSGTIPFERLPFDHPAYIMYSSGTTGPPKCIVHGAGGTLIQHLKELTLHTDLKREDRIFYFTTCGWMMWNWLVSSLAVGATIVLYDGSPFHPETSRLFDLAEQERLTVFGTSAKYIAAVEKAGLEPARTHDLAHLRAMLSTGSPLAPESFDFVYRKIKRDLCLSSISGGTDIISCFALGNPIGPVYRGELQTRGLGMKVEIFNDQGKAVRGEKGELVCTAPFPSMPVGFWNDPDGKKYRAAYFATFPGVWRHGDYCELTENNGIIIWGRSDAVLNPGGVRIGTAEIYRAVEQLPEIVESLAVGQDWEDDVRVILFVILQPGVSLAEALTMSIKHQIRTSASPRHVPAKVIQVSDIPRTLNGKIAELAVRNAIHNRPVKNRDALANPEALDLFQDLTELKS